MALPPVEGFIVSGCGLSAAHGAYWPDPDAEQLEEYSRPYLQENGECTLEAKPPDPNQ